MLELGISQAQFTKILNQSALIPDKKTLQYICAKHSKSEIIISNDKNFIKTDI